MNVHELPLVIFTVLAQMSVGCFVVLGLIHLFARGDDSKAVDRLSDPALYAIGPVMVLGLIASIFHLGNPVNALHTISHLDSSWLSREIFLGSSFAVLGAAFAVTQRLKWLTPLLRQLLAGLTALVGLGLVFAMSMVYMLPTVPAWDTWTTPVGFFTTTLLLGSIAIGAAFVVITAVRRRRGQPADAVARQLSGCLRGIAVAAIVLLGIEMALLPAYLLNLSTGPGAGTATPSMMVAGGSVLLARLVLVFLGAGAIGLVFYRFADARRDRLMVFAASGAFVFVFASEILGRILFYGSFDRLGM